MGDLAQFMVSHYLPFEDISKSSEKMAFPESVVQYLRVKIGAPPRLFPELSRYKVLKYRNLDPAEGHPRAKLGEYNFDKANN